MSFLKNVVSKIKSSTILNNIVSASPVVVVANAIRSTINPQVSAGIGKGSQSIVTGSTPNSIFSNLLLNPPADVQSSHQPIPNSFESRLLMTPRENVQSSFEPNPNEKVQIDDINVNLGAMQSTGGTNPLIWIGIIATLVIIFKSKKSKYA